LDKFGAIFPLTFNGQLNLSKNLNRTYGSSVSVIAMSSLGRSSNQVMPHQYR